MCRRIAISILAILIALPSLAADNSAAAKDREALAKRVVELLAKPDPKTLARRMHYPASYTDAQRDADVGEVEESLDLLLRKFGTPSRIKREPKRVTFFEVGGGGGDMPYWKSLSPLEAYDFIYSAHFSKLGAGIIKVRVFRHPQLSKYDIQSVEFGLLVTRTDAKAEIVSVIKEMMRLDGMTLPPNIDELLEQNLKPAEQT